MSGPNGKTVPVPVEIRDKQQYERALDKLHEMFGAPEKELESKRFDALSASIEKYEKEVLEKAA